MGFLTSIAVLGLLLLGFGVCAAAITLFGIQSIGPIFTTGLLVWLVQLVVLGIWLYVSSDE